jgi:hypothetical protein
MSAASFSSALPLAIGIETLEIANRPKPAPKALPSPPGTKVPPLIREPKLGASKSAPSASAKPARLRDPIRRVAPWLRRRDNLESLGLLEPSSLTDARLADLREVPNYSEQMLFPGSVIHSHTGPKELNVARLRASNRSGLQAAQNSFQLRKRIDLSYTR